MRKIMIQTVFSLGLILLAASALAAQNSGDMEERTLYVGPQQVYCVGVGPQLCLQVKEDPDVDFELFYNQISGFDFVPGYEYELRVEVEEVENPPEDASALRYHLIEVVSMVRALEGNTWSLDSYQGAEGEMVDVLADTPVTLIFDDEGLGGSASCNSYGGEYTLDGDSIEVGELITTLMLCAPEAVGEQESAYLALLQSATGWQITDDQLELTDASGTVILSYSVLEPTPLTEATWVLTSYNNGSGGMASTLPDTEITALFEAAGMSGSAGCNGYSASVMQEGTGYMNIGPAVSTRMACGAPEGIMEQEIAYLTALESVSFYSIRGDRLELRDSDYDVLLTYEVRAEADPS